MLMPEDLRQRLHYPKFYISRLLTLPLPSAYNNNSLELTNKKKKPLPACNVLPRISSQVEWDNPSYRQLNSCCRLKRVRVIDLGYLGPPLSLYVTSE